MFYPREFIELRVSTHPQIEDELSDYLINMGSTGCIMETEELIAYFPVDIWSEELLDQIIRSIDDINSDFAFEKPITVLVDKILDKDYNAEWKKSLKAIEIDPGLIIKPSWINLESVKPGDLIIEIDPQMAFGSGMHATTQLVLRLMHRHWNKYDSVVDIGTGSGILAIAAAKMGCDRVVAFDNDPVAVFTAQENIIRNGAYRTISLFVGTIDSLRRLDASLVVMNINRTVIIEISERIGAMMSPGEYLILSGVLNTEGDIIRRRFSELRYSLVDQQHCDEWIAFVFIKM